jgi:hypothetical protein
MYGFCKTKLQNSLLDVFSENELPEYKNKKGKRKRRNTRLKIAKDILILSCLD